jgi:hypothetical protein
MTAEIAAEIPSATELVELYRSVGWTADTNDPEALRFG